MKKRFWQIAGALILLIALAVTAASCAQQTQTLTDLLLEVNQLARLTADGEVYISIHDKPMEDDFAQDGLPADLLQDATIKYHIDCDNEALVYGFHLEGDFACYNEPLYFTFYLDKENVYVKADEFLKLCQIFAEEDYAEVKEQIGDHEWLACPLDNGLEEDFTSYLYGDLSDAELQTFLDEVEKFRSTVGQAYAGFSVKAMEAKGNSFKLELDNAGLADLINDFIGYTLDNFDTIAQAFLAYINSSEFFSEADRADAAEFIPELIDEVKEISMQERLSVLETVRIALTVECPMDFQINYNFAKTAADTYTLDEKVSIVFDEEYYGEPSDVLMSVKNTSKAVNDLQINMPAENILWLDDLYEDAPQVKADM